MAQNDEAPGVSPPEAKSYDGGGGDDLINRTQYNNASGDRRNSLLRLSICLINLVVPIYWMPDLKRLRAAGRYSPAMERSSR